MKRKAPQDSETKLPEIKKTKKVFTGSDFIILLSDSSSAHTGLATFISAAKAHLEDRNENDVVEAYCKSTSDCKEIFDLLADKLKGPELFPIFESLYLILFRIFSDLKQYEIVGQAVAKTLVTYHIPAILKQTSISNKSSHVKSALKLLSILTSGICSMKWGWISKEVLSKIDFSHTNWTALINRKDAKDSEDVKFCLFEFICNLLLSRNMTVLKSLAEAKNFIPTLFDHLHGDNCVLICKFLDTILNSVVNNTTLTKTFKIRFFNEKALKALCRLYNWTGPKSWQQMAGNKKDKTKSKNLHEEKPAAFDLENLSEEQELVRSQVHNVLVQLCSSFKNGIIFKDKSTPIISGQNPNHVITNLLQNFTQSFYKDPLMCDLALHVFSSCPDQLHFFLGSNSFAGCLTPRVSRNWFTCSQFVTQVFQGQSFTPRTFPLFLLSGDPQKMGENYVRHVLPPKEIWKKYLSGLLEQHEDQVMLRCLDFISVSTEGLLQAKHLIEQNKKDCTDLYESNKQFYNEFEISFSEGLKKNLPKFVEMVERMERYISKEKAQDDEESDDKKKAKEFLLQELPAIEMTEAVGKFLQVLCNLGALVGSELSADDETMKKIITTVESVLVSSSSKEDKKSKKRRSGLSGDDDDVVETSSKHSKFLLLHFWKFVQLRQIPIMKFVSELENERSKIIQTSLDLISNGIHQDDDDDDDDNNESISHVMLLDAFSQVLMACGVFSSLDEIRSWLRNLRPVDGDKVKKYTKKCSKFFLSTLASLVESSANENKSSELSLFLMKALEEKEDSVIETYVDNSIFEIVATSCDPISVSSLFKSRQEVVNNKGLLKSKQIVEFLTSDKLKKKCKNLEFEVACPGQISGSDIRSLQHQVKMICFAAAVEALRLTKTKSSNSSDADKLNECLNKLSESVKDLNKFRSHDEKNTQNVEEERMDDDENNTTTTIHFSINKQSKAAEFYNSIFEETCTFVFSNSFLQTFFTGSLNVVNDWFSLMTLKLPQVIDHKVLETIMSEPIKKMQTLLTDLSEGKATHVEGNHLLKLVKCFSPFLPQDLMKTFCIGFILDHPKDEHDNDNDVKILTESGDKFLARKDVTSDDVCRRTAQYLKDRIMKSELSDDTLKNSFDFILKLIKLRPSESVELLSSKKNKHSFFNHLIASSNKIKLNFIQDLMKFSTENETLLKLSSTWLEENKETWSSQDNWSNYVGILVEFVRLSNGGSITKDIGHCLWSQVVRSICSGGDALDETKFVFEAIEKLFEEFGEKISNEEIKKTTAENWNKFIKAGLKHHLMNKSFINILSSIIHQYVIDSSQSIPLTSLHPSIPDVFNMVIGHSMFMKTIMIDGTSPEKESIFKLLHTLATAVPEKCCQANLVPLLFGSYSATLSPTDKCILSLLHMSEKNGSDILQYKPYYWGQKSADYQASKKVLFANVLNHGLNELLDQIDPKMMMDTALNFPFSGKLDFSTYSPFTKEASYFVGEKELEDDKLYNPSYFLPAFYHLLDQTTNCRKFIEKNCLGLVIASLTSHETSVRNLGSLILSTYRGLLESSKFIDRHQIMYMLDALKNGIEEDGFKISSVVSAFMVRASNILMKPDHHMYILVNQFLLLKPAIDLGNVPEFYKLFFSSSLEHKKERAWFLEMLADGLRETKDYHICEKRKVFKCIMSFYTSPLCDQTSKVQILKILISICSNSRSVVWTLIKKQGFLSWISAAFFAFSGNLNGKWATDLASSTVVNSAPPASLQTLMGKLVQLLQVSWSAVDSSKNTSRSKTEQDGKENESLLSPTVLAEFILTIEHLLMSNLCFTSELRSSLVGLFNVIKMEAGKTETIFKNKGFAFPLPMDAL